MDDSSNNSTNLNPLLKNTYSDKIGKLMEKPNSSKAYFSHLKKYLKKASKNKK